MTSSTGKPATFEIVGAADTKLTISQTFDLLTDIDIIDRLSERANAKIIRRGDPNGPITGLIWEVTAAIRRKVREFTVTVADLDPPRRITYHLQSAQYEIYVDVSLNVIAADLTRMQVAISADPNTLAARMVLHSLRMAKHRLRRRLERNLRRLLGYAENQVINPRSA